TAVWRAAAACGTRPGHRARASGLPNGRTAEQPRREAARADAGRDQEAARPAANHHDLCHPRPGRGDDDGGPDCGDERWARATGRHAAQPLWTAGEPLRAWVYWQPGDELHRLRAARSRGAVI